jgi:hypothetical protein
MRHIYFFLLALSLTACSKLSTDQLTGRWEHPDLGLDLLADQQFDMRLGAGKVQGRYRIVFNSLEMINTDGKVIFNINVRSVSADSMQVDLPTLGTSRIYTLAKVK